MNVHAQVAVQVLYILFKRLYPKRSDSANGLRIILFELLDNINVARLFEFINLNAQISRCGIGFSFKKVNSASFTLISRETTASLSCECNIGSRSLNMRMHLFKPGFQQVAGDDIAK